MAEDLTGKRFGKVLVIEKSFMKNRRQYYLAKCDCGVEWSVCGDNLTRESRRPTRNCYFCGRKKAGAKMVKYTMTESSTRLYHVWNGMKRRCKDDRPRYKTRYKDRGITVCEEWLNKETGCTAFMDWALSNGYEDHLTIDRIDNNKGYYPENCRWATPKEQMQNREMTIKVEIEGRSMTIREAVSWCNNVVSLEVARRRIREGWDPLKALTTPKLTRKGETYRCPPSDWIKYPPESFSITLIGEYEEK